MEMKREDLIAIGAIPPDDPLDTPPKWWQIAGWWALIFLLFCWPLIPLAFGVRL